MGRNIDVIRAFVRQDYVRSKTINMRSYDNKLLSYETIIAQAFGEVIFLSDHNYSSSTSKQMYYVRSLSEDLDKKLIVSSRTIVESDNANFEDLMKESMIIYTSDIVELIGKSNRMSKNRMDLIRNKIETIKYIEENSKHKASDFFDKEIVSIVMIKYSKTYS